MPEPCRKCGGQMRDGIAIEQTFGGIADFPGKEVVTLSPAGPGKLVKCLKCNQCGWSMTKPKEKIDD